MVINKFIVIYYIFLFCSVAVGLMGGVTGLAAISKWRPSLPNEMRFNLETRFHLSSSAILLGSVLRLVMLPLWFLMLESLLPFIPGAMCLIGVHQNVPVYSWLASSMKVFLPLFYFTWILITVVDRKFAHQPFLRYRHLLLLPISVFILAEALIDLKYISSVKAVSVSCCTTGFDNSGIISALPTDSHWYFVIIFFIALAAQTMFFKLPAGRSLYVLGALNSFLLFFTLPLGLHNELSPMFSGIILHKCIFCLLHDNRLVMTGSFFIIVGIYLSFAYSVIGFASIGKEPQQPIKTFLQKIKFFGLAAFGIGVGFSLVPFLLN